VPVASSNAATCFAVTASPEVLQDSTLVLERRKSERNNKRNKQINKAIKNKQVTE
jgi:hypothetical protein